jgi:hypothetical protein
LARAMRETTEGFIRERNDAGRTVTAPMLLTSVPPPPGPISRPVSHPTCETSSSPERGVRDLANGVGR